MHFEMYRFQTSFVNRVLLVFVNSFTLRCVYGIDVKLILIRFFFRHPDDIDLYTGGMTENHVPGGNVGPTFACILGKQFHALKYGDRFWYENRDFYTGFTQGNPPFISTLGSRKVILPLLLHWIHAR